MMPHCRHRLDSSTRRHRLDSSTRRHRWTSTASTRRHRWTSTASMRRHRWTSTALRTRWLNEATISQRRFEPLLRFSLLLTLTVLIKSALWNITYFKFVFSMSRNPKLIATFPATLPTALLKFDIFSIAQSGLVLPRSLRQWHLPLRSLFNLCPRKNRTTQSFSRQLPSTFCLVAFVALQPTCMWNTVAVRIPSVVDFLATLWNRASLGIVRFQRRKLLRNISLLRNRMRDNHCFLVDQVTWMSHRDLDLKAFLSWKDSRAIVGASVLYPGLLLHQKAMNFLTGGLPILSTRLRMRCSNLQLQLWKPKWLTARFCL